MLRSAKAWGSWQKETCFLKLRIGLYLGTKIQVYGITLMSFRRGNFPPYTSQNEPLKSPFRLGLNRSPCHSAMVWFLQFLEIFNVRISFLWQRSSNISPFPCILSLKKSLNQDSSRSFKNWKFLFTVDSL